MKLLSLTQGMGERMSTHTLGRREFLRLSLLAAAATTVVPLAACNGSQSTDGGQEAASLRVGVDSGTFSTGYRVADLNSYFQENGIKAELTTFSYGIDTLDAILSGQVDVGIAADYALLSRLSTDNLRIISYVQATHPDGSKIVARDGITSPDQLEGKSFGVARATVGEYQTSKYLEHYGLTNVNRVQLSSNSEIVAALQRGDVQVGIFSGNALEQALVVEGATVIGSLADIDLPARAFLVAATDYAKNNPEVLTNLLKAVDEALEWTNKNEDDAASILAKSLSAPEDATLTELNNYTFEVRLSTDDVQALKNINEYAAENDMYDTGFELTDTIDTEPLQSAFPDRLTYKASDLK